MDSLVVVSAALDDAESEVVAPEVAHVLDSGGRVFRTTNGYSDVITSVWGLSKARSEYVRESYRLGVKDTFLPVLLVVREDELLTDVSTHMHWLRGIRDTAHLTNVGFMLLVTAFTDSDKCELNPGTEYWKGADPEDIPILRMDEPHLENESFFDDFINLDHHEPSGDTCTEPVPLDELT